jgi:hypothetical protein
MTNDNSTLLCEKHKRFPCKECGTVHFEGCRCGLYRYTETRKTKPINQCDGCRAGLPLENGIHRDGQMLGLVCTADRYT